MKQHIIVVAIKAKRCFVGAIQEAQRSIFCGRHHSQKCCIVVAYLPRRPEENSSRSDRVSKLYRDFNGSWHHTRVGAGGFKIFAGRVGSGYEVFETSRIGSGRVRSVSDLTDRVGSGRITLTRSDP